MKISSSEKAISLKEHQEMRNVSFIIPAKNEAASIGALVEKIRTLFSESQILVVNDGSNDETAAIAEKAGATVLSHPTGLGNGAAIKTGARYATGDILVMLDADGQHDPKYIPDLLERLKEGYCMVVGARSFGSHANSARLAANGLYNVFASMLTGHRIPDLTSGFRAVRANYFRQFLYLLPNGFSYPTTITMAFMRAGYPVTFMDIRAAKRIGKSHIRPLKDGVRFLLIIFKIATLYSPLKIFFPASFLFFVLGLGYYGYTFMALGRFTNMSLLLFSASVIIFLIGLVSEQITALNYRDIGS